ncbi:unnamed protein product [Closterium sp. Naga37s-1]|nr:unnamed protein product [Closterium sp. Naga37s-1]
MPTLVLSFPLFPPLFLLPSALHFRLSMSALWQMIGMQVPENCRGSNSNSNRPSVGCSWMLTWTAAGTVVGRCIGMPAQGRWGDPCLVAEGGGEKGQEKQEELMRVKSYVFISPKGYSNLPPFPSSPPHIFNLNLPPHLSPHFPLIYPLLSPLRSPLAPPPFPPPSYRSLSPVPPHHHLLNSTFNTDAHEFLCSLLHCLHSRAATIGAATTHPTHFHGVVAVAVVLPFISITNETSSLNHFFQVNLVRRDSARHRMHPLSPLYT